MPNENPFHEENPTQEVRGDEVVNVRSQRIIRIQHSDGNMQEIPVSIRDSRPDGNGGFVDIELDTLITDHSGNVMPQDPHDMPAISHTGLYIDSPEKMGACTSWLHGSGPKIFSIGQDGRQLSEERGRCSRCDFKWGTICFVIIICALGISLGIWRGVGLF